MRRISLMASVVLAACGGEPGAMGPAGADGEDAPVVTRRLDDRLPWHGDNLARLQQLIDDAGVRSAAYDPAAPPLAVFDWDNTVVKNDIGDAVTFYMLNNDLVLEPASWAATSPHLTAAAVASLDTYCPLSAPRQPLNTSGDAAGASCADAILCVYYNGMVWDGTACSGAAFALQAPATSYTIEPAYAWTVSLQAGYEPDEVRAIGRAAIESGLFADMGEKQTVGTGQYNRFVRIYEQIADLIATLRDNGFDIWVVSASSQYIVEPFAQRVGIAADHVIGVRARLAAGVLTAAFEGCGDHADGSFGLISYRAGKRCWLNKVLFPESYSGDASDLTRSSPIVFAAGDSNTDLEFLLDASELRLAINRNKTELMCHAYANTDGNWIVNPMFIQPLGRRSSQYDCTPYELPDQDDSVFGY